MGDRTTEAFLSVGTCPDCGKQRYATRKKARQASRRMQRRLPGPCHINAYPCGDYWHLGHLPKRVTSGRYARDSLTRKDPA